MLRRMKIKVNFNRGKWELPPSLLEINQKPSSQICFTKLFSPSTSPSHPHAKIRMETRKARLKFNGPPLPSSPHFLSVMLADSMSFRTTNNSPTTSCMSRFSSWCWCLGKNVNSLMYEWLSHWFLQCMGSKQNGIKGKCSNLKPRKRCNA